MQHARPTRDAHTTATEPGSTIPAHDKPVAGDGRTRPEGPRPGDREGSKPLKEAHFTATEEGSTIPAHDKLVPKD